MSTWHLSPDVLAAYVGDPSVPGAPDPVLAASVEAHLLRCAACRAGVAAASTPADSERRWARLAEVVDSPRRASWGRSIGSSSRAPCSLRAIKLLPTLVAVGLAMASRVWEGGCSCSSTSTRRTSGSELNVS